MKTARTTHTPGPWAVENVFQDSDLDIALAYEVAGAGTPIVIGHAFEPNDETVAPPHTMAEAEANARLWAAAPDLLAACKAILGVDNPPAGTAGHVDLRDAYQMAYAAIAKATA